MQTERAASIRADELGFRVEAKALLERVRLHADQGQLVGLIGPNGAGKSTLLRAIAGVLRPQEGAVWLEGEELSQHPGQGRRGADGAGAADRAVYARVHRA